MKRQPLPAMFHATLDRLRESTRPIVVGPWMSEIGYELLYWIPFLAWVQETYQLDPARFVVVSRGGCQAWYAHLASQYYDIFSWYTPERFAAENAARIRLGHPRKSIKQQSVSRFEHEILLRVRKRIGDYELLHPSIMYRAFWTWRPWTAKWQTHAKHQPFHPVTPLEGLPARYVAVRFYTSSICPERSETRELLTDLIRDLLSDQDVVLLNTGSQFDDHREVTFPTLTSARLHRLTQITPRNNLEIQTRVIAGASRFVGTYGGFSYLAPLLGVNAETVYGDHRALAKLEHHLVLAREVFKGNPRFGWLTVENLREHRVACV